MHYGEVGDLDQTENDLKTVSSTITVIHLAPLIGTVLLNLNDK